MLLESRGRGAGRRLRRRASARWSRSTSCSAARSWSAAPSWSSRRCLQLLPEATEALSEDRRSARAGRRRRGESVIDLYLSGGLPALGAGGRAGSRPSSPRPARERPASVVAELGVAAGWRMPLPRLAAAERPSVVVTAASTPPLAGEASAALGGEAGRAPTLESWTRRPAPPHIGAPAEVAALARELSRVGGKPLGRDLDHAAAAGEHRAALEHDRDEGRRDRGQDGDQRRRSQKAAAPRPGARAKPARDAPRRRSRGGR